MSKRVIFILIHCFHESSHLSSGPSALVGSTKQLLFLQLPRNLQLPFERGVSPGMSWSSLACLLWQQW